MPATDQRPFEELTVTEANDRLRSVLDKLDADAQRPRVKRTRRGAPHTARTKAKLSAAMFSTRKAQKLAANPTEVCRLRLARGLTLAQAAKRAIVNERTWTRAESDFGGVSALTQKRVASALGVDPAELH